MNPVVHFEMPYEDRARMMDFYAKTFGWEPHEMGPAMGDYFVITTSERDPATNFPKKPGMINGGFFKKSAANAAPGIVMSVPDIRSAMARITEAGGTVVDEPMDIPGNGIYVSFIDTEGNRASIIQPLPM